MANAPQEYAGIYSLAGFAFQIKAFIYYLGQLPNGEILHYEMLDDISQVKNIDAPNVLDNNENKVATMVEKSGRFTAIQVKKTKVSKNGFIKVLYNWLLLANKYPSVEKFILFTNIESDHVGIENIPSQTLYELVQNSKKDGNSLEGQVHKTFPDAENFFKTFDKIRAGYVCQVGSDIEREIARIFAQSFRYTGVQKTTYCQRLREFANRITAEILSHVSDGKTYSCSYPKLQAIIESVSNCVTDEHYIPDYSAFLQITTVDLQDPTINNLREYRQLLTCDTTNPGFVSRHLMYMLYYKDYRFRYMENNQLEKIKNIDTLSYDNFCDTLMHLKNENRDTPYNRLENTKSRSNSYAICEEVRFGSCIYLTSEDVPSEQQISWKDEDE